MSISFVCLYCSINNSWAYFVFVLPKCKLVYCLYIFLSLQIEDFETSITHQSSKFFQGIFQKCYLFQKFKSIHQENLKNIVYVKFYKDGRHPNLIYIILFDSSVFLGSGFQNSNYFYIKNGLISKFLDSIIQSISIGNFQTSWSSSFFNDWLCDYQYQGQ